MCHRILEDTRFFTLLEQIDEDLLAEARAGRCPLCDGRLDTSDFPRKPRGGAASLGPGYDKRLSLCCDVTGCRHRVTPPSVRFLGRKVYLGAIVVLATALQSGINPWRMSRLRDLLGVSIETLKRWRVWWRESFGQSPFFETARAFFKSPVDAETLPLSLLESYGWPENPRDTMAQVLALIKPITTWPHLNAVPL
ncbi:hypothetical protein H8E07_04470 [bacterium]|nr:hypothetical protein [bacterium]